MLVMVGDGPERVDAEQEARQLGVQDRVFFLGKLEAVAPLLASADLFLLPTQSESFGLSALEALATGRAGDRRARRRTARGRARWRDGRALRRRATSRGWRARRSRCSRDDARWQAASTLAASDARERFSMDQVVGQYEAFYEDALRGTVRADDASSLTLRRFRDRRTPRSARPTHARRRACRRPRDRRRDHRVSPDLLDRAPDPREPRARHSARPSSSRASRSSSSSARSSPSSCSTGIASSISRC